LSGGGQERERTERNERPRDSAAMEYDDLEEGGVVEGEED
jgi:hypothetical protein